MFSGQFVLSQLLDCIHPQHFHRCNAARTQLWVAVCVYALVAIFKKRLGTDATLYEILQILSVSVFEKTPIEHLFQAIYSQNESTHLPNQLSFWDL